ncbi:hypothetical protein [Clostridium isatidis]
MSRRCCCDRCCNRGCFNSCCNWGCDCCSPLLWLILLGCCW